MNCPRCRTKMKSKICIVKRRGKEISVVVWRCKKCGCQVAD